MKRGILNIVIALCAVVSLVGCGTAKKAEVHEINRVIGEEEDSSETEIILADDTQEKTEETELLTGKYAVLIEVENYGDIFVELDADAAPITVTNFMKLVNEDFYTGLKFHRIIEGFMMQGGQSFDKQAANIKGEFALNGIDNSITHERGTISMARANDPDSANSQFFICHQDSFFLDGMYAGFGHVVSGMDVVDKICEEAVVTDDNGTVPQEYQPVIAGIYDVTAEYIADALGEHEFIPANDFEEVTGRSTFESYDEIISLLSKDMGYAYVDVLGADEPVLLIATSVYDNQDGNMASIQATPYLKNPDGTVVSGSLLTSGGTAYPIAVLDGIIYCGSDHETGELEGACISNDYETPGIMNMFYLYKSDKEGNSEEKEYGGFIRDENSVMTEGTEVAADDDKPYNEAWEAYSKATIINFTVVE